LVGGEVTDLVEGVSNDVADDAVDIVESADAPALLQLLLAGANLNSMDPGGRVGAVDPPHLEPEQLPLRDGGAALVIDDDLAARHLADRDRLEPAPVEDGRRLIRVAGHRQPPMRPDLSACMRDKTIEAQLELGSQEVRDVVDAVDAVTGDDEPAALSRANS
jgi:hypothetical protein